MRKLPFALATFAALRASAGTLSVPAVTLPSSEPLGPSLLFTAAELPALQARKTVAPFSDQLAAIHGFVDAQLTALANAPSTLDDDLLAKVAYGAALMQRLGETPPASTFASYTEATVAALKNVGSRRAANALCVAFSNCPSDTVDVLLDSSRLQAMAHAYDEVRSLGLSGNDDRAMRSTLAAWATAIHDDVNLTGTIGVPGHRDNWAIKGGSALITVALAMPTHGSASGWAGFGKQLIDESLAAVASDTGWYRESAHYLNYSLGNLALTVRDLKNARAIDWATPLQPWVTASMCLRQPNGEQAPFEEGVPAVFPWDVMAGAYPALAPRLQWLWQHSSRLDGNFGNQSLPEVTRFVLASDAAALAPAGPGSCFLRGDAHAHVLRNGWEPEALQLTTLTAVDHATTTTIDSRHNTQNPMDLVVAGAGSALLVTSSGGPEVTRSTRRSYYLQPSSKNVPLVRGTAPFIANDTLVRSSGRLLALSADGGPGLLSGARTRVTAYAGADVVERTVAMVGGAYFAVGDAARGTDVEFALPFHVRGTFGGVATSNAVTFARWSSGTANLSLASNANGTLTTATAAGFYAPAFGTEEQLTGLQLQLRSPTPQLLTVLQPWSGDGGARPVVRHTGATAAGLQVNDGALTDELLFGAGQAASGNGFTSTAVLTLLRRDPQLRGLALLEGTEFGLGTARLFSAAAPTSLSLEFDAEGALFTVGEDQTATFTLEQLPGLDASALRIEALLAGVPLTAPRFEQTGGRLRFDSLPAGSTVRLHSLGSLDGGAPDAGAPDAGTPDAGPLDAGAVDGGAADAGLVDAGPVDAGVADAGPVDAGAPDAGPLDAGPLDAGPLDAGVRDAGPVDAGPVDAGEAEDGGEEADGGIAAPGVSPGCGCAATPAGGAALLPWALLALGLRGGGRRRASR